MYLKENTIINYADIRSIVGWVLQIQCNHQHIENKHNSSVKMTAIFDYDCSLHYSFEYNNEQLLFVLFDDNIFCKTDTDH